MSDPFRTFAAWLDFPYTSINLDAANSLPVEILAVLSASQNKEDRLFLLSFLEKTGINLSAREGADYLNGLWC